MRPCGTSAARPHNELPLDTMTSLGKGKGPPESLTAGSLSPRTGPVKRRARAGVLPLLVRAESPGASWHAFSRLGGLSSQPGCAAARAEAHERNYPRRTPGGSASQATTTSQARAAAASSGAFHHRAGRPFPRDHRGVTRPPPRTRRVSSRIEREHRFPGAVLLHSDESVTEYVNSDLGAMPHPPADAIPARLTASTSEQCTQPPARLHAQESDGQHHLP
jgi:hypothetical protein